MIFNRFWTSLKAIIIFILIIVVVFVRIVVLLLPRAKTWW